MRVTPALGALSSKGHSSCPSQVNTTQRPTYRLVFLLRLSFPTSHIRLLRKLTFEAPAECQVLCKALTIYLILCNNPIR